jgi:hypothetical protein
VAEVSKRLPRAVPGTRANHPDSDSSSGTAHQRARLGAFVCERALIVSTRRRRMTIGKYREGWRCWQPAGYPGPVEVYDFADKARGEFAAGWIRRRQNTLGDLFASPARRGCSSRRAPEAPTATSPRPQSELLARDNVSGTPSKGAFRALQFAVLIYAHHPRDAEMTP